MHSATQHREKKDRKAEEVQAASLRNERATPGLRCNGDPLDYWSPRWWHAQVAKDVGMIFENNDVTKKTICEMQKTVLMDSETTTRKVLSDLIQQINE